MLNRLFQWGQPIFLLILFLGVQLPKQESFADSLKQLPVVKSPENATAALCRNDLKTAIEDIINRPEFKRSRWGILIQTLDNGDTLYSLDAEKYFLPASNVKLLTTAAVLLQFGSQFRIRTSAYGMGNVTNLETLQIVGKGDPSFTTEQLRDLVQQLKRQGIRKIKKVIVENSYFKQTGTNPSWEWEDIFFSYGTSVNSLILNENSVTLIVQPRQVGRTLKLGWSDSIAARQWQIDNQTLTISSEISEETVEINGFFGSSVLKIQGSLGFDAEPYTFNLSIVDPDRYFLESLLEVLVSEGIQVEKGEIVNQFSDNLMENELAFVESEPLAVLIQKTNQESNNLYAEALLQILASQFNNITGTEAIAKKLTELGVNPDGYVLVDGSGLSRHNLVTPEAIATTLRLMAQTPEAKIYQDSLAVAGASGTLAGRFKNTLIAEHLQAKTGTLSGNSALSGYLNLPGSQPLVFSIIVNQSNAPASNLRTAIDEIIVSISHLKSCKNFSL